MLFIALLFATRLFQRWLRERALQQTRMDPSIVNSIDTVVGYAGIAIASLDGRQLFQSQMKRDELANVGFIFDNEDVRRTCV